MTSIENNMDTNDIPHQTALKVAEAFERWMAGQIQLYGSLRVETAAEIWARLWLRVRQVLSREDAERLVEAVIDGCEARIRDGSLGVYLSPASDEQAVPYVPYEDQDEGYEELLRAAGRGIDDEDLKRLLHDEN